MKLLVLLFILKLYARINIFKLMEKKYGQNTIKLARIIEKQRTKLSKLKCDTDYLLQCKRRNLIPTFARPKIAIQISNYLRNKISKPILEAELTNKLRKKKMLLRQINANQNELKDRIGFIFYTSFASKIGKSIRKTKKQWTETHKKKLRHLSQTQQKTIEVTTRFTDKIIHNFSNYALSQEEKQALSYSLDKRIPVKLNENKIQTEFESFYCNIMKQTGHLRQNEQDQLKSKIRRTCENYYRIRIPYRYEEIIKELSNNKNIIILRQDKGRGIVVLNRISYIEKRSNILTSDQFKVFENGTTKTLESKVRKVLRKIKMLQMRNCIKGYTQCH